MDMSIFVQNVINLCTERGVSQKRAFEESHVGRSFLSNIAKGSAPSVDKVQQLATYFDVTTSELLGETQGTKTAPPELGEAGEDPALGTLRSFYRQLNAEGQKKLIDYAEDLVAGGRYIKSDSSASSRLA